MSPWGVNIGAWARRTAWRLGIAAVLWIVVLLLAFAWLLHASGRARF